MAHQCRVGWQCTHLISEIIMRNVKYEIPCHHITTLIIIIIMQTRTTKSTHSEVIYSTGLAWLYLRVKTEL